jgi:hypothetical protein
MAMPSPAHLLHRVEIGRGDAKGGGRGDRHRRRAMGRRGKTEQSRQAGSCKDDLTHARPP